MRYTQDHNLRCLSGLCGDLTATVVRRKYMMVCAPRADRIIAGQLWQSVSDHDTVLGAESAQVKVVELFDHECPFCRQSHFVHEPIRAQYPDEAVQIFRHRPLSYRRGTIPAAIAAECADEQGAFDAYHNLLFANQSRKSDSHTAWVVIGEIAGVPDLVLFQTCIPDEHPGERISADTVRAGELGIERVRTLFVDGAMNAGLIGQTWLFAM